MSYYYQPPNPLVYSDTSDGHYSYPSAEDTNPVVSGGYYSYPSAADMTPSQSQSSDSSYSSGMPSPMSPRGPYSPSTSHDVSHNRQPTGYEHPSSHSSEARNSRGTPPQTSSSTRTQKAPKDKPYVCLLPKCEASFTRPFDLSRHQKTTHIAGCRIDCPEVWCGRNGLPDGREKGGFSRLDHFKEHVKKVHRKEVVKNGRGGFWVKSSDGRMCEAHWTNPSNNGR